MEGSRATRISNVVTVRCLGCGELYAKPLGGGTVRANPGCPECGYVGWVLAPELPREASPPDRSYEDHPRRRSA
jgi:predicted  nucleic acid-binding Zn-ribbon protein